MKGKFNWKICFSVIVIVAVILITILACAILAVIVTKENELSTNELKGNMKISNDGHESTELTDKFFP